MRVLVTGNLGYIGPIVTRHLKAAGHYVIGLDAGWFLSNLAAPAEWPHAQMFGDIRSDGWDWDIDAVVHLAGLSNDPMGDLDPKLTHEINVAGTVRMLGGHATTRRHVVVSSCSVYGTADMATEETPVAPLTAYAQAKVLVDNAAARLPHFRPVSLRLGTVYGWSPGHRLDLVVNRMVYDATHGLGITVNGNAARPLIHVEDVARAIVFMLGREETGVYNVVGENWRMQDLGEAVQRTTSARMLLIKAAGGDARDYMADGSKLRALGCAPRNTVESALPDLIYKSADLGRPERYIRLKALRRLIGSGYLGSDLRHTPERIAA